MGEGPRRRLWHRLGRVRHIHTPGNCGHFAPPLIGPATVSERFDLIPDWRTFDEYLSRLERQGIAVNVVTLVGVGQSEER